MSANLTPADLAKFVHLVPVGATIPAGTECAWRTMTGALAVRTVPGDEVQLVVSPRHWTAEPILTPEHARLEAEYTAACERVYAAEAAMNAARSERDDAIPASQRLYHPLRAEGLR